MKQLLKSATAILLAVFLFAGCKPKNDVECNKCKTNVPDKEAKITVGTLSVQTDIWRDEEIKYTFASGETNGNVAEIASGLFGYQNVKAQDISAVLLFLNADVSSLTSIAMENILGYGIYFRQENKLRFQFFLKENGRFSMVSALNSEARKLSSNDVYNLAELYFLNGDKTTTGYSIINKESFFQPNESRSHSMGNIIKFLLSKKNNRAGPAVVPSSY